MYRIIQLNIDYPVNEELRRYAALIPEKLQASFFAQKPRHPDTKMIAFAALFEGQPVGITFASCTQASPYYETQQLIVDVEHLFVSAPHRGQHLGRRLLSTLQTAAEAIGGHYFSLIYPLQEPETPIFEKVVAACGWEGKRLFLLSCLFNGFTFDIPYAHTEHHYPPGFEEFLWSELTPQEHADLLYRQRRGGIGSVSPLIDEEQIELMNSLGLRHEGRVIGWMINHRISADTICYKSLYVEPGLAFHTLAPKLIFNSIRRHMQCRTQWAVLEIPLIQVKKSWKRFVEHRIVPYAVKVTQQMQAWHIRSSEGS